MAKEVGMKSPTPENKATIQEFSETAEAAVHELGYAKFAMKYENACRKIHNVYKAAHAAWLFVRTVN